MKPGIILLIAGAALFFLMKENGGVSSGTAVTDQKRAALNSWFETSAPPNQQIQDAGRFQDVISNISPDEIDVIYSWVFDYYKKGIPYPTSGPLYTAMQAIISNYQIFT